VVPVRRAPLVFSGPAHSTDCNPPSRARDPITSPRPQSASSPSARYTEDLPVPLAPVTTVSSDSGRTISRSDR